MIADLLGEPTIRSLAAGRITTEREGWRIDRDNRAREHWSRFARLNADRRLIDRPKKRELWCRRRRWIKVWQQSITTNDRRRREYTFQSFPLGVVAFGGSACTWA